MQHGFVKLAAFTPAVSVADCASNQAAILAAMEAAARQNITLLALPEMSITGCTLGDLTFQSTLLTGARNALADLTRESTRFPELITVLGLPLWVLGKVCSCAAVVKNGVILGLVPKTRPLAPGLPDDIHPFAPAPVNSNVISLFGQDIPFGTKLLFEADGFPEFCFAVEICEDLCMPFSPSARHAAAGATIIVSPAASSELSGKSEYLLNLVLSQSARLACGYVRAAAGEGESTTDLVFSGHHIIAENGRLLSETKPFEKSFAVSEADVFRLSAERARNPAFPPQTRAGYQTVRFPLSLRDTALSRPVPPHPFIPEETTARENRCELILSIQAAGLKKRIAHSGIKRPVIGLSGGLDSALALLVAVRATDALNRPRSDILAVTMPCFGTTRRTKKNAEKLAEALCVSLREVDITESVRRHFRDIGQPEDRFDTTFENAQARERTQVLMDIANMENGLVIGTGDLSELALGWATYNGDHMSMYGVNGSVPKTLVRYMVRHEAEKNRDAALRVVLLDILDTPVSPELLPAENGDISQETESLVGPYELHDFFLYYMIRFGFPPGKIYRLAKYAFKEAYPNAVILHWLRVFYRRFFAQQFKRSCLPDGPQVGSVSLSPRGGWRMPSDASAALWLTEIDRLTE